MDISMPYTAPNQKVITINRKPLGGNFLGINNENWKYAARVLGAHAFLLYIYFASNKDDFKLALSPQAIQKEIGMPPSTFRDQLKKLEAFGFLVPDKGNLYNFYEVPEHDTRSENARAAFNSSEEKSTAAVQASTAHVHETPPEDIQIYINNKDEETNTPGVKNKNAVAMSKDEFLKRQFDSQWFK
jgi:hypothetical protein